MDFTDMIVSTFDESLTGYFYKRRPKSHDDGAITFQYKQLDPNSRVFDKVLGNIRADSARYAISTNDDCGFNVGGYIVTQNGLFWQITEVVTNEEQKATKNALRWFKRVTNADTSIRMIQVNDLYAVEDVYTTKCKVTISVFVDGVAVKIGRVSGKNFEDPFIEDNEATITMEKNTTAKVRFVDEQNAEIGWVTVMPRNSTQNHNYITADL